MIDAAFFSANVLFWVTFVARAATQHRIRVPDDNQAAAGRPTATAARESRLARIGQVLHLASGLPAYTGAVIGRDSTTRERSAIATAVAVAAWLFVMWTLQGFRSWRLRADIDPGHELATTGPFALVRHPIYAGMELLAIAVLIFTPNVLTALGLAMGTVGAFLRVREEEATLERAFGDEYASYARRVKRFIPGVF